MKHLAMVSLVMALTSNIAAANMADEMLAEFKQQGIQASAQAGETLWNTDFTDKKTGQQRNCTTCHGKNLSQSGEHAKTGKVIDPMAPSVNSERLTERKKINKWFKRNCKWTVGRECTAQEKADVLTYLKTL